MDWWKSLRPREQLLVGTALAFSAVALLYLLVWEPVHTRKALLDRQIFAHEETLEWMREASVRVRQLQRGAAPTRVVGRDRSLLSVIDQTAKQANLRTAIKRIEPEGQSGAKVRIEDVPFDILVGWLGTLNRQYGVTVARANFEHAQKPGRVDSRLSLSRP